MIVLSVIWPDLIYCSNLGIFVTTKNFICYFSTSSLITGFYLAKSCCEANYLFLRVWYGSLDQIKFPCDPWTEAFQMAWVSASETKCVSCSITRSLTVLFHSMNFHGSSRHHFLVRKIFLGPLYPTLSHASFSDFIAEPNPCGRISCEKKHFLGI